MPKKKSIFKATCLYSSLGALGLFSVWLGMNLVTGTHQRIQIGESTTYITTPSEDRPGHVDYAEFINRTLSQAVTAENNSVVLLLPYVPSFGTEETDAEYYAYLGVKQDEIKPVEFVPPKIPMDALIQREKHRLEANGQWNDGVSEQFRRDVNGLLFNPWQERDFPTISQWLNAHQAKLDQICTAAQRTRFFSPLVPAEKNGLVQTSLMVSQTIRDFCEGLALRAMFRLGLNDIRGCQDDLVAIRRLSNHVANGPFLLHKLISYSLLRTARKAELAMAANPQVSGEQLQSYLENTEGLTPDISRLEHMLVFERLVVLDTISTIAYDGIEAFQQFFPLDRPGNLNTSSRVITEIAISMIDWNVVLRETNRFFDQVESAVAERDFLAQTRLVDEIENEIQQRDEESHKSLNVTLAILGGRTAKGKLSAHFAISYFAPMFSVACRANQEIIIQEKLLRVLIACEIHRRSHKKYPATITEIPTAHGIDLIDPYSGQPFVYQAKPEPVVYSVGPNQKDDQGRSRLSVPSADDVQIQDN